MQSDNHQSPLAIAYAQALLELANESKIAESIGQELSEIRKIVETTANFAQLLADPSISKTERAKLLDTVFKGRTSTLILNFMKLLNVKGRLNIIGGISGAYGNLLDKQNGKVEVDVTVAVKLDDAQMELVRSKVSDALKKKATVHQYVEPEILGGLILRVQDQLIDGSVRTQLREMGKQLHASRPR